MADIVSIVDRKTICVLFKTISKERLLHKEILQQASTKGISKSTLNGLLNLPIRCKVQLLAGDRNFLKLELLVPVASFVWLYSPKRILRK